MCRMHFVSFIILYFIPASHVAAGTWVGTLGRGERVRRKGKEGDLGTGRERDQ